MQQALAEVLPRLIDRPVPTAGGATACTPATAPSAGSPSGGYTPPSSSSRASCCCRRRRRAPGDPSPSSSTPAAPRSQPALAGLQAAGLATVVWEGAPDAEAGVAVAPVALAGGLRARVRRDELVAPDGRAGFRPDATVPRSAGGRLAGQRRRRGGGRGRAAGAGRTRPADGRSPRLAERVRASAVRYYPEMAAPAPPYRLLALFRFWNAIRYFFPYLHLLERDWEDVLREHLPAFARAGDAEDYARCVARLAAETRDTHAFVGSRVLRRLLGTHGPPVVVREVEGQTVVTHLLGAAAGGEAGPPGGPAVGDVVVAVDGEPAGARRARLAPLLAASTPQALRWRLDRVLLAGAPDSAVALTVRGAGGATREVVLRRSVVAPQRPPRTLPVYGRLPEGFGYVDLERLTVPQVDDAFAAVLDAPGLIFDLRGYPNGTAWPIAPWLTEREVVTARFRALERHGPDPDAYSERHFRQTARPSPKGRYRGKVVVLIDEEAISQAEHSCLFLEAAGGATFIGGPTNGANGDVTSVVLPGGDQRRVLPGRR